MLIDLEGNRKKESKEAEGAMLMIMEGINRWTVSGTSPSHTVCWSIWRLPTLSAAANSTCCR